MKKLAFAGFVLGLLALTAPATAADKDDVTGTWKSTFKFNDKEFTQTFKLEQKGDKVTGTVSGGKNDTKIEDGTIKGGELKFTVTRERNGQKFTSKYTGKVSGDTIKGSVTSDFNGKENKRDWEAKREKK
jgi:hypothetical protein